MQITLDIDSGRVQLYIDGKPCFPGPAEIKPPIQLEWLYNAILWHLERRGYEGHAVFFREPFEESPYKDVIIGRKVVNAKRPDFTKSLSLEELGL